MYNINLEESEQIKYTNDDVNLYDVDKVYKVSVVVTNKRLFLLEDVHNTFDIHLKTRGFGFIPQMEIIYETSLDIIEVKNDNDKVILNDIVIDDTNLLKVLNR